MFARSGTLGSVFWKSTHNPLILNFYPCGLIELVVRSSELIGWIFAIEPSPVRRVNGRRLLVLQGTRHLLILNGFALKNGTSAPANASEKSTRLSFLESLPPSGPSLLEEKTPGYRDRDLQQTRHKLSRTLASDTRGLTFHSASGGICRFIGLTTEQGVHREYSLKFHRSG